LPVGELLVQVHVTVDHPLGRETQPGMLVRAIGVFDLQVRLVNEVLYGG